MFQGFTFKLTHYLSQWIKTVGVFVFFFKIFTSSLTIFWILKFAYHKTRRQFQTEGDWWVLNRRSSDPNTVVSGLVGTMGTGGGGEGGVLFWSLERPQLPTSHEWTLCPVDWTASSLSAICHCTRPYVHTVRYAYLITYIVNNLPLFNYFSFALLIENILTSWFYRDYPTSLG